MRGFLGLTCYYKNFVKGYGHIAALLAAFLRKNSFYWGAKAEAAFHQLKLAISSPPVLALPNFTKTFTVECDASSSGISDVLMQELQPIAFHSQVLKDSALTLSTYKKEFLALISAMKKWRPYLVERPFVIKTDRQNLKYLLYQRIGTPFQQKWLSELLGYAFVVEYKKGSENVVANALFRRGEVSEHKVQDCQNVLEGIAALNLMGIDQNDVGLDRVVATLPSSSGTLYIISFPTPTWVAELKASYGVDSAI